VSANPALRPALSITASVLAFAVLIEDAGLMPAVAATIVLASFGSPGVPLRQTLVLAAVLAAALALLFVGLLDQPFILFPGV